VIKKLFGYAKNLVFFLATHFIPGAGYWYIQTVDNRVKVLEAKIKKIKVLEAKIKKIEDG